VAAAAEEMRVAVTVAIPRVVPPTLAAAVVDSRKMGRAVVLEVVATVSSPPAGRGKSNGAKVVYPQIIMVAREADSEAAVEVSTTKSVLPAFV
jgi:hypothetical protein